MSASTAPGEVWQVWRRHAAAWWQHTPGAALDLLQALLASAPLTKQEVRCLHQGLPALMGVKEKDLPSRKKAWDLALAAMDPWGRDRGWTEHALLGALQNKDTALVELLLGHPEAPDIQTLSFVRTTAPESGLTLWGAALVAASKDLHPLDPAALWCQLLDRGLSAATPVAADGRQWWELGLPWDMALVLLGQRAPQAISPEQAVRLAQQWRQAPPIGQQRLEALKSWLKLVGFYRPKLGECPQWGEAFAQAWIGQVEQWGDLHRPSESLGWVHRKLLGWARRWSSDPGRQESWLQALCQGYVENVQLHKRTEWHGVLAPSETLEALFPPGVARPEWQAKTTAAWLLAKGLEAWQANRAVSGRELARHATPQELERGFQQLTSVLGTHAPSHAAWCAVDRLWPALSESVQQEWAEHLVPGAGSGAGLSPAGSPRATFKRLHELSERWEEHRKLSAFRRIELALWAGELERLEYWAQRGPDSPWATLTAPEAERLSQLVSRVPAYDLQEPRWEGFRAALQAHRLAHALPSAAGVPGRPRL